MTLTFCAYLGKVQNT